MSDTNAGYVTVDGTNLVLDGERVVLRGFGLGNWLNLEHFMLGIPGTEAQIREAFCQAYGADRAETFWEQYRSCYLDEDDFELLSAVGVNAIRLPFNYHLFEDDLAPYQYDERGFAQLDRALALCERYRILAILDLHAAPGGQNPDWHCDNAIGEALFWQHPHFQERTIRLWQLLARRYREHRQIAAYDLLNEPCLNAPAGRGVARFFDRLVAAVREVDENHVLFVEGDLYARDFTAFEPTDDPNVAYTFHYYPFLAQLQNPGLACGSALVDDFKRSVSLEYVQGRLERPLWCGETGLPLSYPDHGKHRQLLYELIELFEREGISWSLWCYKDARAMGAVHPKMDSPWMRFSQRASGDFSIWQDFAQARREAEELEAESGVPLTEYQRRRLMYRRLADRQIILAARLAELLRSVPFDELLSYPESFRLGSCDQWPEMLALVSRYAESKRSHFR
jgi:endoglucanase